jgi:hypothetical protein
VFEYFRLIKNKDIERLMDLFAPDAIIYEPFSKLTGGLKGKQAIESFLRIVIMANDALQHHIIIEKDSDIHRSEVDDKDSRNNKNNNNSSYNMKLITALVMFEKGDSLKARFRFELSSDHNNNATNSKHNKIKALHIQFI